MFRLFFILIFGHRVFRFCPRLLLRFLPFHCTDYDNHDHYDHDYSDDHEPFAALFLGLGRKFHVFGVVQNQDIKPFCVFVTVRSVRNSFVVCKEQIDRSGDY